MSDDQDGCEWVSVSSGTYPGSPGQKAVKRLLLLSSSAGCTLLIGGRL